MPKRSQIIAYTVIALVIVWVGSCVIQREQPAYVKWKLKRQLRNIEPWTASTNYSAAGWKQLVRAAGAFQQADPQLAADALAEHLQRAAGNPDRLFVEQGKLFLLLRVIFDLREHESSGQSALDRGTRGRSGLNADGTVNLAWPLALDQGKPRLVAGHDGMADSGYSVRDEYAYLRYQFKYRDLSGLRVGNPE